MHLNREKIRVIDSETASSKVYDVVIVGAGVAGAIVAKELSKHGKSILILEAGTLEGLTPSGFQSYVERFYQAVDKNTNAPYPLNHNALSPTEGKYGYFEEQGKLPISGSYTRIVGGATMHWEGKTLRMLPEDFKLRSNYGQGLDWPISYKDIQPYYRKAEYEIGVSGNIEEQKEMGIPFLDGYDFPMEEIPHSYLGQQVAKNIDGSFVEIDRKQYPLKVSSFPQGRNGAPIKKKVFEQSSPHVYQGVVDRNTVDYGQRCQGNANCVSICPVQAKYDARKTLNSIVSTNVVHILPQAVADRVEFDSESGRVTGIHYKRYRDIHSSQHELGTVTGTVFVLAANAIENAKLMLASELPNTSGMLGRNLMDHPFLLAWALMPDNVGAMRGPQVTSGIASFRSGEFRSHQAAFSIDIHNEGWGWSGTSVSDVVRDVVDNQKKYGVDLREELKKRLSRQILLACMCELPADSNNRVCISRDHKDRLGVFRPVMQYNLSDYCKRGIAAARTVSRHIFKTLNAEDYTVYDPSSPAYFEFEGEGYSFQGGNHFAGTHIMGDEPSSSVVNDRLQCWDHDNLYLAGSGSMPSLGSANITLSLAALSFRAADSILKDLDA